MRKNPEATATSTLAATYSVQELSLHVLLFDLADRACAKDSFRGYVSINFICEHDADGNRLGYRWTSLIGSAMPGYGPILYTLGATLLGRTIFPSEDRSADANRFWSRQPGGCIRPLTADSFFSRFHTTPGELMERGAGLLTPENAAELIEVAVDRIHAESRAKERREEAERWRKESSVSPDELPAQAEKKFAQELAFDRFLRRTK